MATVIASWYLEPVESNGNARKFKDGAPGSMSFFDLGVSQVSQPGP